MPNIETIQTYIDERESPALMIPNLLMSDLNSRSLSQRARPSFGKNRYRGVNWHRRAKKWQVCIKISGKNKYFGSFDEELDGLRKANKVYADYFPNNPELQQLPQKEKLLDLNKETCSKW